jgi:hypothetical protein
MTSVSANGPAGAIRTRIPGDPDSPTGRVDALHRGLTMLQQDGSSGREDASCRSPLAEGAREVATNVFGVRGRDSLAQALPARHPRHTHRLAAELELLHVGEVDAAVSDSGLAAAVAGVVAVNPDRGALVRARRDHDGEVTSKWR